MSLEFVTPATETTFNFLLYGGPGAGKTTAACSAPGPVLVVNAEPGNPLRHARQRFGADRIREVDLTGPDVLDEVYLHLKNGGPERTVVLDSVGEAFRIVLEDLAGGGKPTLPNYGDATTKIERFCRSLLDLPQNVVIVAHETTVKDENEGHFERLPVTGTSNPQLGVKLMAMVDVVAYCGRKDAERDGEPDRYMGQLVSANGRRGKDRTTTLGKFAELDLSAWIDLARTTPAQPNGKPANAKTTAKEATPA